jgi:predicted Zn-dependent peptidase
LVAAGKIDFDELVAVAKRVCGQWEPFEANRIIRAAEPHTEFVCMEKATAAQAYAVQLANGPSGTDPDRYAAKILATVLGDDSGSRLYWELVDPGHAETAALGHSDHHGTGLYLTYMSCAPEDAGDNLQRILDIYRAAEQTGITEAELAQAKNKINSRVVLGSERPRGRLFNIGGNWLQRREYRTVKDDLDVVESVTLADIEAVLKKHPLSISTTVVIGPQGQIPAPR